METGLEYEWVVVDPILGEVSCDSQQHALEYAEMVEGKAYCLVWENGEGIYQSPLN